MAFFERLIMFIMHKVLIYLMSTVTALSLSCAHGQVGEQQHVNAVTPITVTELKKWAYVQKALSDELQLSQTKLNKAGAWLREHRAMKACIGTGAGALMLLGCDYLLNCALKEEADTALITKNSSAHRAVTVLCYVAGSLVSVFIATYLDSLLEQKTATAAKALKSFVQKWPEHREKVPQVVQILGDELYAQRKSNGALKIIDQQALKLVEGILALSVVTQLA
jgi:hypothetical protein